MWGLQLFSLLQTLQDRESESCVVRELVGVSHPHQTDVRFCVCEGFISVLLARSHQDSLDTFPTPLKLLIAASWGRPHRLRPPVTCYPLTTHSWKNPSDTAVFVSGGQIAFRCHSSVLWGRGSKCSGRALWWLDGCEGTCQTTTISHAFNLPNIKWWKRGFKDPAGAQTQECVWRWSWN